MCFCVVIVTYKMATVCFLLLGADYSNGSLKCYEDAVMFYGEGDSCFLSVGTAVPASPLPGQGSYTLYPNPASNYIQLHADFLPPYQPVDFALYDINGRLQYQKTLPNASAPRHTDISHLPAGMYIYEFSQNRQVLGSGKLLKLPSRWCSAFFLTVKTFFELCLTHSFSLR